MRIISLFPTLVAVMAVLTFSMPFATLAQQNTLQVGDEAAAARDVTSMSIAAKFAAARDANRDVRIRFGLEYLDMYTDLGYLTCGIAIGAGAGCIVGGIIYITTSDSDDKSEAMLIGAIIGSIVGGAISSRIINNNQTGPPTPSPIRFMGKSPKYIQFYTDAYRVKTRSLWKKTQGIIKK